MLEVDLPVEIHAAAERQKHIHQITGAELSVDMITDAEFSLYICNVCLIAKLGLSQEALVFDGYVVQMIVGGPALAVVKPPHFRGSRVGSSLERIRLRGGVRGSIFGIQHRARRSDAL